VPGDHGVHIHEFPSCGDAGAGAGSHWNPADAGHGFPQSPVHHLGDLGNLLINSDGTGSTVLKSKDFYVKDGPSSVINHAIIYHSQHDDGTQPSGNSGARLGCGVIQKQ
jgi:Cu-Zn family superoxide dismutase